MKASIVAALGVFATTAWTQSPDGCIDLCVTNMETLGNVVPGCNAGDASCLCDQSRGHDEFFRGLQTCAMEYCEDNSGKSAAEASSSGAAFCKASGGSGSGSASASASSSSSSSASSSSSSASNRGMPSSITTLVITSKSGDNTETMTSTLSGIDGVVGAGMGQTGSTQVSTTMTITSDGSTITTETEAKISTFESTITTETEGATITSALLVTSTEDGDVSANGSSLSTSESTSTGEVTSTDANGSTSVSRTTSVSTSTKSDNAAPMQTVFNGLAAAAGIAALIL